MIRPRIAAALAAVGLAAGLALVPSTALAAAPSTIAFADLTPISTGFMGEWHAKLVVTVDDGAGLRPAPPAQGTVDVFVQGIPGPWMTGLPVGADGSVYVAQPIDQPFLPAGTHDISATYVPAAGGYVETSQTASPLVVTITPLTVAGTVEIVPDTVTASPVIQGTLGGSWVDELKGSPAGTWAFSVADAAGKVLFSAEAPVAQGTSDPAAVPLDATLDPGATYTVTGEFTPVAELAGGITLADVAPVDYTEAGSPGGPSVPLPIWALIALAVLIVGLATVDVVFIVRGRRRAAPEEGAALAELEP